MNTKDKAERTANETISDLTKKLNTVSADFERFCDDVKCIRAIFKAVQYAMAEGVADEEACAGGICLMLDNLFDSTKDSYSMSDEFVRKAARYE